MSRSRLDAVANVAIIAVCVIASVVLIRSHFFPPQPPPPPDAAKVGERFAALGTVVPAGADRAVVIAVSPQCHFCNESMPFYKQLVDHRDQSHSATKVIAAVPTADARAEEAQKFAANGIHPDGVVQVDFSSIKVPGTPTLMIVDRQGKVLDVWVGKLEEGRQHEVLEKL